MTQQPIFINRARAFVIAQFSVGGLMVLLALLLIPVSPSTLVLLGAGLVLFALWVLWQGIRAHQQVNANAPNVVPTPKHNTELVRTGIYAHIRHPLYTGVIGGSLGLALAHGHLILFALWVLLFLVMFFKSRYEESLLRQHYAEYAQYMTETGRFFPRLR
jgi:protein-S-isoprenylcysteine O-methyltransferase Ste14